MKKLITLFSLWICIFCNCQTVIKSVSKSELTKNMVFIDSCPKVPEAFVNYSWNTSKGYVFTDKIICDKIYISVTQWTSTNNKIEPECLQPRTVKYIFPVQFPDGQKWFGDDGTYYNVVWVRLLNGEWIPIKNTIQ